MTSRGSCAPTRGDCTTAVALDADDEHLLTLVARLPLAPLRVLVRFLNDGESTAHRRVRQLCDRGQLTAITSPLRTGGRPARLLLPTQRGLVMLGQLGVTESAVQRGLLLRLQRLTPVGLLMDLPSRLATYELAALLAATGPGLASLEAWERPWRRALPPSARAVGGTPRIVRLPAAATLAWDSPDGMIRSQYLLVPDTGGLALPALRGMLGRVAEHQAASVTPAILVTATTTPRRAAAWTTLLESVCSARHVPLLTAHIVTWANLREAARTADQRHQRPAPVLTTAHPVPALWAASAADASCTASDRTPPTGGRLHRVLPTERVVHPGQVLGPLDRAVLDLVGRHPFLSTDNLAVVLDRDVRWASVRRARLVAQGLLRVVPAEEVATPELAGRGLLELTHDGLRVLAAQLGLPLGAAVRHHGLAGGGPATPIGPRAALLAHLPHTLGADTVFALLARAAWTHPGGGALLEWRNAAACAHGRLRPDGYGLLRLGQQQYGFFLEFDRGSMRPGRLRAKFVAYHRYRSSAHASRAYTGFPLILVVTTGPGPERRLARAIRAADAGQATPLRALLTTTGLLACSPAGPFGRVWRTAGDPARRPLTGGDKLPGRHPAGWLHRQQVVR